MPGTSDAGGCPNLVRKRLAAFFLACGVLRALPALGCSCAYRTSQGFIHAGADAAGPQLLPADAKGVLFLQPASAQALEYAPGGAIVDAIPEALSSGRFAIVDETTKKKLPVRLKRLPLDETGAPSYPQRFFRLRSATKLRCLKRNEGEECRLLQRYRFEHRDWLEEWQKAGDLEDVTAAVERSFGLFRVEPVGGFAPEHAYSVRFAAGAKQPGFGSQYSENIRVKIDSERVLPLLEKGITLQPKGEEAAELLPVSAGGSCSQSIPARVQRLKFGWPAALKPYESSLAFFVSVSSGAGARAWHYQSSLCSQPAFGRSEAGFGEDIVYASCSDDAWTPGLKRATPYAFTGYAGLLEVEDAPRASNEVSIAFSKGSCDVNTIVSHAAEGPSSAEQVCRLASAPAKSAGEARALLPTLEKLAKSDDARIRQCSLSALSPLAYSFQHGELDASTKSRATRLLASGLSDSSVSVRQAAAQGLRDFARIQKIAPADLDAALAALSAGLRDDESGVRVACAETIYSIGPAAKSLYLPLLAALNDPQKPNYAIAPALTQVAPDDPRTASALREALRHKDPIVRGSAATALSQLALPANAGDVDALLAAARENNADAITALGKLGPAAQAAVPYLARQALESKWAYIRQRCMESLSKIAPDDPATLKAIRFNLNHPQDAFDRQKALEALGTIGRAGLAAVPDMIAVIDRQPTDYEAGTLVRAWTRMQPPAEKIRVPLTRLLDSKTRYVREESARYLMKIAPHDGAILTRLLGDDDESVVHAALQALQRAKPKELTRRKTVLAALAKVLRDDSRYDDTRRFAYAAAEAAGAGDPGVCAAWQHRVDAEKNRFQREYLAERRARACR